MTVAETKVQAKKPFLWQRSGVTACIYISSIYPTLLQLHKLPVPGDNIVRNPGVRGTENIAGSKISV